MQLHDILQLRTSVILPEAISDGGLAPTTDTSLFLTTYRGGSHLPSDIFLTCTVLLWYTVVIITDKIITCRPPESFRQLLNEEEQKGEKHGSHYD